MRQNQYLFLASISMLAGCTSTTTLMVNGEGQFADCGTWGVGILGAGVALIRTQDCINEYRNAGYRETGSPPALGSQPAAMQDASSSPTTVASKNGLFKMTLPSGWTQFALPSSAYQLYARNLAIDSGLLISSIESKDIQDWEAYARSLRATLANSLSEGSSSEDQRIKVNGFDAIRVDVSGDLRNGVKLHYLGTAIKAEQMLVWLVAWCAESRFTDNRSELEKLATGLRM